LAICSNVIFKTMNRMRKMLKDENILISSYIT